MSSLSGVPRVGPVIPGDPVTTRAADKVLQRAPEPVQKLANPVDAPMRGAFGDKTSDQLIALNSPNADPRRQTKTLLGE